MVLAYDQHPEEIDWNNKKELFSRLYRVRSFSDTNSSIYFMPHNISKFGDEKLDVNGLSKPIGKDYMIKDQCIKVIINKLGEIKRAF